MPIVYRCKHCGFILHVFVRVGQNSYGVPTPSELMSQYGDHCPRCGHRLTPPSLSDIIIKPNGPEELLATLEEAKRTMRISFRGIERYLAELRRRVPAAAGEETPSFMDPTRSTGTGDTAVEAA